MVPSWLQFLCGDNGARINVPPFSPAAFVLLLMPLYLLKRRGKSNGYLVCFSLFFLYAWAVVSFTLLDLPVHPVEIEILRDRGWASEVNLIPTPLSGKFAYWSDQVRGNFLLGVPFGLGWPFLAARSTHRRMMLHALAFAAGIEMAQLLLGLVLYQAPYRVIDIDDVWLVFSGALVGYGALWVVARVYRRLGGDRGGQWPVWDHFHEVLRRVAEGRSPEQPRAPGGAAAGSSRF